MPISAPPYHEGAEVVQNILLNGKKVGELRKNTDKKLLTIIVHGQSQTLTFQEAVKRFREYAEIKQGQAGQKPTPMNACSWTLGGAGLAQSTVTSGLIATAFGGPAGAVAAVGYGGFWYVASNVVC